MNFLINNKTNHVIIEIAEKELDTIIKSIQTNSGFSRKDAKKLWMKKMIQYAQNHHGAFGKVDFKIV